MSEGPQGAYGWGQSVGQVTGPDWAALAEQNEQDARRRKQRRVIGAVVGATLVIGGITATAVSVAGHGKGGTTPAKVALDAASTTPTDPASAFDPSASPAISASGAPSGSPSPSAGASTAAASAPGSTAGTAKSSAKPGSQQPGAPSAGAPAPSSSGPRDPLTVISSASTDTAPLDPATLFPDRTLTINGHTWTRVTVASTSPCWKATTGGLGDVLAAQGCQTLLRATYSSGNSAVTIGVAVFDQRSQADAAQQAHKGQVQGLVTTGSTSYCVTAGCANTHGAVGRYGYYTVSGTLKPGGNTADATATSAGPGFASYARGRLLARGQ